MKKIFQIPISLAAGALMIILIQGPVFDLITGCTMVLAAGLVYYLFFRVIPEMDQVEILQEYKRGDDAEDPEEILP